MFMLNAWYALAWSHEIGRDLFSRKVCGQPIVAWRKLDGTVAALTDRCWHRLLPLSKGTLKGDAVQCAYHGLTFDGCGTCVHAPAQDQPPKMAKVRSYPIAEKNRMVWVWTGDPALADPALVPDLHWLGDPKWAGEGTTYHVACNYQLVSDNLLDLTHETFVHASSIGDLHVAKAPITTRTEGDRVIVTRWILDHDPAAFWKAQMRHVYGYEGHVDRWQIIEWYPPANIVIDVGVAVAGTGAPDGDRSKGLSMRVVNTVTPETERSCHYFFINPRNYRVDDPELTLSIVKAIRGVFSEDVEIFEAQQKAIDETPDMEMRNLGIDSGSIRARKILAEKIAAEAAASRRASAEGGPSSPVPGALPDPGSSTPPHGELMATAVGAAASRQSSSQSASQDASKVS